MSRSTLLTRDAFREAVFARDGHQCVFCKQPDKYEWTRVKFYDSNFVPDGDHTRLDAHHIIERRLWSDGGYYIDNGATVCGACHWKCEATTISVETVREAAGITKIILPEHLYSDQSYDKWGNPCMSNGTRLKGELFFDESVQKILGEGGVFHLFVSHVKYPRTYHLPWSPGLHDDDRMMSSLKAFESHRVIVTEKMDGENTTLYSDYIHARSVDGRHHESRNWVKQFWSSIKHDIPDGWRICGENLYAAHSIRYGHLPTYFMGFSIWNERNVCLDWDTTLEWFTLLGITPVPVIYEGIFNYDQQAILDQWWAKQDQLLHEGYVMRVADEIPYGMFRYKVGKFVRKDHVRTVKHWMHGQRMVRNELIA